jgi:IS30 family transposase
MIPAMTTQCAGDPSVHSAFTALDRHRATIHHEIRRNHFHGQREYAGYYPVTAQDPATERRRRRCKLCRNESLRRYVIAGLERCWSPEQIAGRLKRESACDDTVCHETIYRYVYGPEGRDAGLYRHLPKARARWAPNVHSSASPARLNAG